MRCLRDFSLADEASITAHSTEDLQQLMNRFRKAFQDFGLTISLKKTRVIAQNVDSLPNIAILKHELQVVNDFVSLILFLWSSSYTSASARLLLQFPSWLREYGPTRSWRKIPGSRSAELAFWAHCCTAASPGFFTHDGRGSLTFSTCAVHVSDTYLASPGRTEFQTTQSWSELKFPICIHYWNRDVCAGSAMLWEWMTAWS